MTQASPTAALVARYRRFAEIEAAGRSPSYEALAHAVASTAPALAFLASLPPARQQPNLFFAALRHVTGQMIPPEQLAATLEQHGPAIAHIMSSRTTQTNEPGRCAALLPALAQIEGPIALVEVGASAGLCLWPDIYGYEWQQTGRRISLPPPALPAAAPPPVFPCDVCAQTPLPTRHPEIVWRAGLDLNPLDVCDSDDRRWLETLVWPEQTARLARLRAAMDLVRSQTTSAASESSAAHVSKAPLHAKPHILARIAEGDLTRDLPALLAEAPRDATLVVFHTAVLTYVQDQSARDRFAQDLLAPNLTGDLIRHLAQDLVWLSNEGLGVFPQFAGVQQGQHPDLFLLCRNGRPLARSGPHGQSLRWLPSIC